MLCFVLSMPNNNSWDGKWSGEGRLYAVLRPIGRSIKAKDRAREVLETGYFHYNFGDGWAAGVTVTKVERREAARVRKCSQGFCGYDWMVDSILQKGEIKSRPPRP